jgi:hypothetical protein
MLPFDVTILATTPQRLEIPEGLINYPVFEFKTPQWKTLLVPIPKNPNFNLHSVHGP